MNYASNLNLDLTSQSSKLHAGRYNTDEVAMVHIVYLGLVLLDGSTIWFLLQSKAGGRGGGGGDLMLGKWLLSLNLVGDNHGRRALPFSQPLRGSLCVGGQTSIPQW